VRTGGFSLLDGHVGKAASEAPLALPLGQLVSRARRSILVIRYLFLDESSSTIVCIRVQWNHSDLSGWGAGWEIARK
jgi:hypothetical protein